MLARREFVLAAALGLRAQEDELARAFKRLYNFDFRTAHGILDQVIARRADDPMGYSTRASALLFEEMNRLGVLEADFFIDNDRIAETRKLKPDLKIRDRFYAATGTAQRKAEAALASNARDTNALFSLAMTFGLLTDFGAFIERRQLASLALAKSSQQYAVQLLAIDPNYADAYLTTGVSEYLLGSLPFFVKWFVRFEQAKGSKDEAVKNLRRVASQGRYLGPFARILLSVIALREKRKHEARVWLEGLVKDFPENPLLRRELAKLTPVLR